MTAILKNFIQNWSNIDLDYKTFIITEDMCDVVVDSTKWVAPYSTSYWMTWITIKDWYWVEWREWRMYRFIISTKLVVVSSTRNVGIRIWTWAYIPVKNRGNSILGWNSYFIKWRTDEYMYKTTYEAWWALHLCAGSDTTYENKSAVSWWTDLSLVTTGEKYTWNNKQDALTSQTTYTSKWTSSKVPQISTNNLWQVTWITEIDIVYPSQVNDTAFGSSWNWVTAISPSKNAVYDKIASMDTAINGKMPWFSINIWHATPWNPREVKFITINYWNMTQYWAAYFRLSAMSCHPDWWWYNYMTDIYIGCTYKWVVKCDIIKYIQSSVDQYTPWYEWWWKYFGDVFYVVDTDAKKVYFYILWWQYTSSDFTPAVKIWSTSLTNVQQHNWTASYYDTWTKVWANGCWSLVAIKSDIPSKTSQLTNDSWFITSSSIPTDYVKLTWNQTIAWTKTFSISPIVPSKTSAATNTGTAIATEAQVYLKANNADVVKLTGNQTVAWTKTFSTSPVVPSKTTDVANTWTAIATEAQVYKILPTVMTASEYSQVSNPVAGKIYFIKKS